MNTIQKVLVTGCSGLIGHAVASELLEKGISVVGLDRNKFDGFKGNNNFESFVGDVTDFDYEKNLDTLGVDGVIHCAAHPGGKSLEEPVEDVKVNAYSSMRLIDWSARKKKKILFLSSSAVYGDQPNIALKEDTQLFPGTIYAICKEANEKFLKTISEGYGLDWVVVRLFATYGAGHVPNTFQGIVNIMLTQLMRGDDVVVKGSLDRVRSLIHVSDAAKAIVKALLEPKASKEIINAAHDSSATIRDLVKEICNVMGKDFEKINLIEEEGTVGDTFYNYANCEKMHQLLGIKAKHDLRSGLEKLYQQRIGN